jgi:hypothetical protein
MLRETCLAATTRVFLAWLATTGLCATAQSADFVLSDNRAFPGQLWTSRGVAPERSLFRREATPNPAFPRAAMKIGPVSLGPDGKIYFASGLDGYVMHLLDGRNEVVSFEFDGQIRDIDCGGEPHTVYFSVVPTPQNGAPLADGTIYRRDLWAGQPSEVATVRQSQIAGNWWGTFAVSRGDFYIATFETPSRIFKLSTTGPERLFPENTFRIQALAVGNDGAFYFADGTDHVYRTTDFKQIDTIFSGTRNYTDFAINPGQIGDVQ